MRAKILIADDDPICRLLLESSLDAAGLEVVVAGDGDEAWQLLRGADGPLLAILDWHMPGVDGLELCRRLQDLPASHLIYPILLTARTGRDSVILGLEAGARDYITKPFDQEELRARLHVGMRVLALQQALADRVSELEEALKRVKQLQGLLPMCSYCKSIRTDQDYWQQLEHYIADHSDAQFSHGICPTCYKNVVEPQLSAYRSRTPSLQPSEARRQEGSGAAR
jgi:DNA-binding response OmpR family regulator